MYIEIKYLDARYIEGIFPLLTRATEGSAAFDVRACVHTDIIIQPDEVIKIPLGFALNINDPSVAAQLLPRSGLGTEGLILANTVGLIDSDYQGELSAPVWNRTSKAKLIQAGDRIAQLMFIPVIPAKLSPVAVFENTTARGINGFNSTGIK